MNPCLTCPELRWPQNTFQGLSLSLVGSSGGLCSTLIPKHPGKKSQTCRRLQECHPEKGAVRTALIAICAWVDCLPYDHICLTQDPRDLTPGPVKGKERRSLQPGWPGPPLCLPPSSLLNPSLPSAPCLLLDPEVMHCPYPAQPLFLRIPGDLASEPTLWLIDIALQRDYFHLV